MGKPERAVDIPIRQLRRKPHISSEISAEIEKRIQQQTDSADAVAEEIEELFSRLKKERGSDELSLAPHRAQVDRALDEIKSGDSAKNKEGLIDLRRVREHLRHNLGGVLGERDEKKEEVPAQELYEAVQQINSHLTDLRINFHYPDPKDELHAISKEVQKTMQSWIRRETSSAQTLAYLRKKIEKIELLKIKHVEQLMQREEPEYRKFCGTDKLYKSLEGVSEAAGDSKGRVLERYKRRKGIKQIAAIAFDLPEDSSWAELTAVGGYQKYLYRIEQLPKHKHRMDEDEKYVDSHVAKDNARAGKEVVKPTKVSGLTIFTGSGSRNGAIVDKVVLSVTKGKPWSHQPYGGKRNEGEGVVAALVREFGEEAGWDAAIKVARELKRGNVFYLGRYVSKNKKLFIQSFGLRADDFDPKKDVVSGSDSKGVELAGPELLRRDDVVLTEQAEEYMRWKFRFERPIKGYTRWHEGYRGDPWDVAAVFKSMYVALDDIARVTLGRSLSARSFEHSPKRTEGIVSEFSTRDNIRRMQAWGLSNVELRTLARAAAFIEPYISEYKQRTESGVGDDVEWNFPQEAGEDHMKTLTVILEKIKQAQFPESEREILRREYNLFAAALQEFAQRTNPNSFSVSGGGLPSAEDVDKTAQIIAKQNAAPNDLEILKRIIEEEKLLRNFLERGGRVTDDILLARESIPEYLKVLQTIEQKYDLHKGAGDAGKAEQQAKDLSVQSAIKGRDREREAKEYHHLVEIIQEMSHLGFKKEYAESYLSNAKKIYFENEDDSEKTIREIAEFRESITSLLATLKDLALRDQRELTGALREFVQRTMNDWNSNSAFTVNPNQPLTDELLAQATKKMREQILLKNPKAMADELRRLETVIADEKIIRDTFAGRRDMSSDVARIRKALPDHLATLRSLEIAYGAFQGMGLDAKRRRLRDAMEAPSDHQEDISVEHLVDRIFSSARPKTERPSLRPTFLRNDLSARTVRRDPQLSRMVWITTRNGVTLRCIETSPKRWMFRIPNQAVLDHLVRGGREFVYEVDNSTAEQALQNINRTVLKRIDGGSPLSPGSTDEKLALSPRTILEAAHVAHIAPVSPDVFNQKKDRFGRRDLEIVGVFRAANFSRREFERKITNILKADQTGELKLEQDDVEYLFDMLVAAYAGEYQRTGGGLDLRSFFNNEDARQYIWKVFTANAKGWFRGPPVREEVGEIVINFFAHELDELHAAAKGL